MLDYKLYTFLTLCKHMNYRITAEELNMTQPAVTHHIKQLESRYACTLFVYENRTLYKTKQAEILEGYVRSAEYNSGKLLNELSKTPLQQLKIGATKTIGDYIINSKISNLLINENIGLTYLVENTDSLLQKIKNGLLDFALIEGFFNKDEFVCYDFFSDLLVGICSTDHPFAGKSVDFCELFSNKLVLREQGSGTGEAFERILTAENFSSDNFRDIIQTNSIKTITELVSAGLGISFVYESVANKSPEVSVFHINNVSYRHIFSCVHLKNIIPSPYVGYFVAQNRDPNN